MAQNSVVLPTTGTVSGLAMTQATNNAIASLVTLMSGPSAPTGAGTGLSSLAGMWWHDTTANALKIRDQADTVWITVIYLDETNKSILPAAPLTSFIGGFVPTSIAGTNTTATLTVGAGIAASAVGGVPLNLAAPASWAVSNGNAINGYQGGTTLPNSTTIHFFVCLGSSGIGIFASSSLTPTLPTGYTVYSRRIFSIPTNGSGALLGGTAFEIGGGALQYNLSQMVTDVNSTAGTSAALYTLASVPSGLRMQPIARYVSASGTTNTIVVTGPDEQDNPPSNYNTTGSGFFVDISSSSGNATSSPRAIVTNTSAQVRAHANTAGTTFSVLTAGWIDFRRG